MALSSGWTTSGSSVTASSSSTPSANLGDVRTRVVSLLDSMRQRYADLINSGRQEEAVALKDASERLSRSAMQTGMSTAQRVEALTDIGNKIRISGQKSESDADIARIGSELQALELLKNTDQATFNQSFQLAMNDQSLRSPIVMTGKPSVQSPAGSKISPIAPRANMADAIMAQNQAMIANRQNTQKNLWLQPKQTAPIMSGYTGSSGARFTPAEQPYVDPMSSKQTPWFTKAPETSPFSYNYGQVQTGNGTGTMTGKNPLTGQQETVGANSTGQPHTQYPLKESAQPVYPATQSSVQQKKAQVAPLTTYMPQVFQEQGGYKIDVPKSVSTSNYVDKFANWFYGNK